MKETPIVYSFIHLRLKQNNPELILSPSHLKGGIRRVIIRHGGLPKYMINQIVEDLIKFGLVERINQRTYKLLKNPHEKRMRFLINSYL